MRLALWRIAATTSKYLATDISGSGAKHKAVISARLIRIPPPRQQRNKDGSFRNPSDNALAYFVIE